MVGQNIGKVVLFIINIVTKIFIKKFINFFFILGLQIYNSPFSYVYSDPNFVSTQRESLSRLEFIDILYAGYDG